MHNMFQILFATILCSVTANLECNMVRSSFQNAGCCENDDAVMPMCEHLKVQSVTADHINTPREMDAVETYLQDVLLKPMSDWKAAWDTLLNTSSPVRTMSIPNPSLFNGQIRSSLEALAEPVSVSSDALTIDMLGRSLVGLGINVYFSIIPSIQNIFPKRPLYIDDTQAASGLSIPYAKEYVEYLDALLARSDTPAIVFQGCEFARSRILHYVHAISEHGVPEAEYRTGQMWYNFYQGSQPYLASTGMHSVNALQAPLMEPLLLNEEEKRDYDWDLFIERAEKQYPLLVQKYIDFNKRKGLVLHKFDDKNPDYAIGADRTEGELDEEGKPKWEILGIPRSYRSLTTGYMGGKEDSADLADKLLARDGDRLMKPGVNKMISGGNNFVSPYAQAEPYLNSQQKLRFQTMMQTSLAEKASEYLDWYTNAQVEARDDEFPYLWTRRLKHDIASIDHVAHEVVLKSGNRLPFEHPLIFDATKLIDVTCGDYLASSRAFGIPTKIDTTLGYEEGQSGYPSSASIGLNWKAIDQPTVPLTKDIIMGRDTENECCLSALHKSGLALQGFFDDLKGYMLSIAEAKGLMATFSSSNTGIARVQDGVQFAAQQTKIKSDWDAIGYHYGLPLDSLAVLLDAYNPAVRSSPAGAEERKGQLDSFGQPAVLGTYPNNQRFDYVLRQHYVVDENGIPVMNSLNTGYELAYDTSNWYDTGNMQKDKRLGGRLENNKTVDAYTDEDFAYETTKHSYFCKKTQLVTQTMINTLYYQDGGKLVEMGIYPQEVLDKLRKYGVIAHHRCKASGGQSSYGDFVNDRQFTASELAANQVLDYDGVDAYYYQPALDANSPSGGKAQIYMGTTLSTMNPQGSKVVESNANVLLHESIVGHAFENFYPRLLKFEGIDTDLDIPWSSKKSWAGSVTPLDSPDFTGGTDSYQAVAALTTPSGSVMGEGYATWAEFANIPSGIYGRFDFASKTIDYQNGNIDPFPTLNGIATFSRLASRQVMCAEVTYPPVSVSYPLAARRFAEGMGLYSSGMINRFVYLGALQQATYAVGLIQNIVATNRIIELLAEQGKTFAVGKYNLWRALNLGLFGGALIQAVEQNLLQFAN